MNGGGRTPFVSWRWHPTPCHGGFGWDSPKRDSRKRGKSRHEITTVDVTRGCRVCAPFLCAALSGAPRLCPGAAGRFGGQCGGGSPCGHAGPCGAGGRGRGVPPAGARRPGPPLPARRQRWRGRRATALPPPPTRTRSGRDVPFTTPSPDWDCRRGRPRTIRCICETVTPSAGNSTRKCSANSKVLPSWAAPPRFPGFSYLCRSLTLLCSLPLHLLQFPPGLYLSPSSQQ